MATIDVLVATRNRADMTLEAIHSIQGQTFADWHLWLVDDGSEDASPEVLAAAVAEDPRITFFREPSRGAEATRQFAFAQGRAPWVALLDSDDVWLPRKLELQIATARDADAVTCWHAWIRPDGTTRVVRRLKSAGQVSPLWTDNMSTPLIRRDTLDAAGGLGPQPGMPRLDTCEHIDLWIRLSAVARVAAVPEVLVHCRDHSGPRASDPMATLAAARQLDAVVRERAAIINPWPIDHAELLARTGARFIAGGAPGEGYARFASAVRIAPARKKLDLIRKYGTFVVAATARGVRD